jgi:glycosyltransferase involved in cell wall biosynthesis
MQMKKGKPKVSIIVPSYNEEKNISRCIETLMQQNYQPLEIIVIDDGSKDQTLEYISKFKNQNIKVLTQKHLGPAKARNLGVKHASGDILIFADSDMSFDKNFVEDLVRPIISLKYKGTFSKEEYISNWDNRWSRCWNYNQNWPKQKMIPDDYPNEGMDFRALLKSEFQRVGGFDNIGYTDTWSLFKKLGYRPHSVAGAKYYHVNPDNLPEVFLQARWSSKRNYKFGYLGKIIALFRTFLPISLLIGIYKALKYKELSFIPFKITYDLGQLVGILELLFGGKLSK